MTEWIEEWPEKKGIYWFYGWLTRVDWGQLPSVHPVEFCVREHPSIRILSRPGEYLMIPDGARGMFKEIDVEPFPLIDPLVTTQSESDKDYANRVFGGKEMRSFDGKDQGTH